MNENKWIVSRIDGRGVFLQDARARLIRFEAEIQLALNWDELILGSPTVWFCAI